MLSEGDTPMRTAYCPILAIAYCVPPFWPRVLR